MIERKALAATVTPAGNGTGPGEFTAIISTEDVDRQGEELLAGAFEPLPTQIPVYFDHGHVRGDLPIGKARPFYDGKVLKAHGTFADSPKAQEVRSLVQQGIIDQCSVGFANGKRSTTGGRRIVTKGDLVEVSMTSMAVNPRARVLTAKSFGLGDQDLRARLLSIDARVAAALIPEEPRYSHVAAAVRRYLGADIDGRLRVLAGRR